VVGAGFMSGAFLRIEFGVIWAVDVSLWQPAFQATFQQVLS
jgi:hypothetical protein